VLAYVYLDNIRKGSTKVVDIRSRNSLHWQQISLENCIWRGQGWHWIFLNCLIHRPIMMW
jgi:hypothetical protein